MGELMMVWLSAPAGFVGATAGVLLRRMLSEGKHAHGESVAELAERLGGDVRSCPPPAQLVH